MSIPILQYLRDSRHFRNAVVGSDLSREEPFSLPGGTTGIPVNDIEANDAGAFRLDGVYLAKKASAATVMAAGQFVEFNGTTGFVLGGSVFEVIETSGNGDETALVQLLFPEPQAGGGGGVNRKEGLISLGNVSGSVAVDFTTGDSDNRHMRVNGNITDLTPTFGQPGLYKWAIEVGLLGATIPQPAIVTGDWLVQDNLNDTTHLLLDWDGVEATVVASGVDEDPDA